MTTTQYRLSWDSYKSNVCDGFTSLQQNEEFVDMTIAADGYLVKVHKNIFALASPYIKSMLQSTPNEHPVIFLSNISHDVLNYILTYVYTGEVSVEADKIQSFMRVAKELRLSGFSSMPIPKINTKKCMKSNANYANEQTNVVDTRQKTSIPDSQFPSQEIVTGNAILNDYVNANKPTLTNIVLLDTTGSTDQINVTNVENVTLKDNINCQKEDGVILDEEILENKDSGLYVTADGYQYKLEIPQTFNKDPDSTLQFQDTTNNNSEMVTPNVDNDDNFGTFEDEFKNKFCNGSSLDSLQPEAISPQYTMSNRSSLQLILNRFMYYCHHQAHGGRKRRWRCIEYRSRYCPAYIDTDGEVMTSRKFEHCHPFHDEKIRIKMKKNMVYTSLNLLIEMQNQKKKRNIVEK